MSSQAGIEATIAELFAAWSTKDPASFGAVFAEDAEFTDVVGNHVTGRQAIADLHVAPFAMLFTDATLTSVGIRMRPLGPGWATVDADWRMTGHTDPTGSPLPEWQGSMHVIVAAEGDGWVPTVVHNVRHMRPAGDHPSL